MNSRSSRIVTAVVFCLAALISTSAWATDSFAFLVEPSDSKSNQGGVVTLYCTVNVEADRIMWVRDTAVITQNLRVIGSADESDRYSIWYDVLTYNLIINGVVPDDAGSYKCVAFSGGNGIISRSARLEVSFPPAVEYPTLTSNIADNTIATGETIEISCEVEGGSPVPEVELSKGGQTLVVASAQLVYVWVTDGGDDGAVFECRATHPLWSGRRSSFLGPFSLVTEPPQISLAPATAEIQIGGTTSFVCSASSAPRAVYRWFINDVEQVTSADQSVVIHTTESVSLLHLRGSRDTSGVVRCHVETATGDISVESSLVLILTEISTSPPTTQTQQMETTSTLAPSTTPTLQTSSSATTLSRTSQPKQTDAPYTAVPTAEPSSTSQRVVTPRQTSTSLTPGSEPAATSGHTQGTGTAASTMAVSDERRTDGPVVTDEQGGKDGSRDVPGASSFDTIFVIAVSTIVSLVAIILIAAVGAFCIIAAKRRRKSREAMYAGSGGSGGGDVFFRSRYISIVRSWFSPVHRDTQNTLTSFAPPTPDQSPYNTISKNRRAPDTPTS